TDGCPSSDSGRLARELRAAADAPVVRPEVAHAALRAALLALGGRSPRRLAWRFQRAALLSKDPERRDDPERGRKRHREDLLRLVHAPCPGGCRRGPQQLRLPAGVSLRRSTCPYKGL